MKKTLIIAYLLSVSVFATDWFYNNTQYIVGERASGLAGAFTSIADDSSAIWYNPAGLSDIYGEYFSLNASTFSYFKFNVEDYLSYDNKKLEMQDTNSAAITNMISYAFRISPKLVIAFGFFIPFQNDSFNKSSGSIKARDWALDVNYSSIIRYSLYLGTLGLGYRVNNNFSIGLMLGGGYHYYENNRTTLMHIKLNSTPETTELSSQYNYLNENRVVMLAGIGFKYKLERHNIGLYLKSPILTIQGWGTEENIFWEKSDNYDTEAESFIKEDLSFSFLDIVIPFQLNLGYSYIKANSFLITTDLILHTATDDKPKTVLNIKIGTEIFLTPTKIFRIGAFTDFSQSEDIRVDISGIDKRFDVYGGTIAFTLKDTLKYLLDNKVEFRHSYTTATFMLQVGKGEGLSFIINNEFEVNPIIKKRIFFNYSLFISQSMSF